ncbi:dual OB domain-containing protein [Candidatus Poriferisodalis sp.]|uniref:dual OB domain-containing protein n=1 Tax=Candidatus Poriferisodalis sp. TaxID=3101277 RepID=UPI003B5B1E08
MPRTEVLCLANSRKLGGRCFAGLTSDGAWVRPVTATPKGELPNEVCILDTGKRVRPLDIVKMKLKRHEPRSYQPENWIVGKKEWNFVRAQTIGNVHELLDDACADDSPIFGTRTDRVTWPRIQEAPLKASLTLVRASRPRFYIRQRFGSSTQTRVRFVHGGFEYDLSVSFEFTLPHSDLRHYEPSTNWYLTISLGEPFADQGNSCFKLVAGALEIPGTGP